MFAVDNYKSAEPQTNYTEVVQRIFLKNEKNIFSRPIKSTNEVNVRTGRLRDIATIPRVATRTFAAHTNDPRVTLNKSLAVFYF